MPKALALLTEADRKRIRLTLQAPQNAAAEAENALREMDIAADIAPFFAGLPALIAASQMVIARAGASTVGELALIGRPSLLVPYPHALDHDQAANAAELAATGGAEVVRESDLTARGSGRAFAPLARQSVRSRTQGAGRKNGWKTGRGGTARRSGGGRSTASRNLTQAIELGRTIACQ